MKDKKLTAIENIARIKKEVSKWPKWKLANTLLAFSEYQRKRRKNGGGDK